LELEIWSWVFGPLNLFRIFEFRISNLSFVMDPFRQEQFLNVMDRDEAERRFQSALNLNPLEAEEIDLSGALDRVLATDILAPVDVPSFDRSNVDGFAVRAEDTYLAKPDEPVILKINVEVLTTGVIPGVTVISGTATAIATGAVLPRGADAVIMIEHTDSTNQRLILRKPVTPGANITGAGSDIGKGETVLRSGEILTSRETGVLAALGLARIPVIRRPRVGILSTGDELIAPGAAMLPGLVFDSNSFILADAVREQAGEPIFLGIVPDDENKLRDALQTALIYDVVLLSGGTSKGAGDLSYRAVGELGKPGIVAHGVALKPGKPLCLAVIERAGLRPLPVVILPGFPTSAIFTFHEFVVPVIRRLGGRPAQAAQTLPARLPMRVNSERGRTEYLLVNLVEGSPSSKSEIRNLKSENQEGDTENTENTEKSSSASSVISVARSVSDFGFRISDLCLAAYPMGKGSGSVTAFSLADGFVVIPRQREYLEAGEIIEVHLLGQGIRPADLVVIGSHCTGLDFLLGKLQTLGFRNKFLAVGSTGGLSAAQREECDVAGIHLLDPKTDTYNRPFLNDDLILVPGYQRLQGIVFRRGDSRFEGYSANEAVAHALSDPNCILQNRNRGSGTRILIDQLLSEARPEGYWTEARSHHAVAAAVAQGRADWGVAIAPVAKCSDLGFIALQDEHYDFVVPRSRLHRPAVRAFCQLLSHPEIKQALASMGFAYAERSENT
jgi:putative molybdopterin biosynthesis protein